MILSKHGMAALLGDSTLDTLAKYLGPNREEDCENLLSMERSLGTLFCKRKRSETATETKTKSEIETETETEIETDSETKTKKTRTISEPEPTRAFQLSIQNSATKEVIKRVIVNVPPKSTMAEALIIISTKLITLNTQVVIYEGGGL